MHTQNRIGRFIRLMALTSAVVATASCGIEKQSPPPLAGPSEFGISLTVIADPEDLAHDGQSQALITVVARDATQAPKPNLVIRWDAVASSSRAMPISLSATTTVTDAQGRTSILLTSPPSPTETPGTPDTITIRATPVAEGFDAVAARSVIVRLRAPAGLPLRNNNPVPQFSMVPGRPLINQDVTFNAQATTDEGEPCLSRCRYIWNFGDQTTTEGMVVTHKYPGPGAYSITLTVVDERNGVGVLSQSLTVDGAALPVANFSVTPASPAAGVNATFNASTSTVGAGATITDYAWNFGDGTTSNSASPITTHSFASGVYIVTLTVTDSLGRNASRSSVITVP